MFRRGIAAFFVVGGCTDRREKGALASVEKVTFEDQNGEIKAKSELFGSLSIPRRSPSLFLRSVNTLSVVGGCEKEGKHHNSWECIRINDAPCEPPESPRSCAILQESSCSAFAQLKDTSAIIVGGFNGDDCLKQVVLFDTHTMEHKKLPDFVSRLKNSYAVSIGEKEILLFGGWDERETMRTVFRLTLNDQRNSFSFSMDGLLPYPVEGHACIRKGDSIFVVGGYDGISVKDSIVRYDLKTFNKEVLHTSLAVARENHVCGLVLDEYLVVAGGWNGREALDSIELFRIIDHEPYLEKVACDVRLCRPRNRPAAIVA